MSDYEKALKALDWLRGNCYTHCIDDETGRWTKDNGGMFLVRVKNSETVSGVVLIEMAKKLGWNDE